VACIGNSITYGSGIKDRIRDSYPAQLGRILGNGYEVRNYGYSARTLLQKGDHPYMKEDMFFDAINWTPDIVIIKLGTNDSKPQNWKYKDEFETDYNKMITSFDTLSSKPKIYLIKPVPVFQTRWGITDSIVKNEVIPLIIKIAKENELPLIDLYTPFIGKGDLFPDHIHPNAEGAGEMAKIIYEHLTGKPGQLVKQDLPGLKSVWKGFKKYKFDFYSRQAFFVVPEKPLEGNPWVWRARFPGWHTEMDSILLSKGFHIAYINTNNMFGSPRAVNIWNRFYNYLVNIQHFNSKVSLEGVSRGGLFIYNWAKQHPDKVNCIYAEAPVCDFKSWPGGFGKGKGSEADWEKLKIEYGFNSDKEAKAFIGNPVDNLETLAKAKVPVLHMVGLKDQVVPVDENTLVLTDRYIKLGGIAKIVPCTEGKQNLWGHHFVIETPRLGADFIKYYTKLPKAKLKSSVYHEIRGGIRNSFIRFEKEKKGRIAFLGGSITYNGGWRDSLMAYIQNRFPGTEFDFISAGIPSMGSTSDAFRLERDILKNGPVDLLFVEAAVNDRLKGRPGSEILRAMEGIVRHMRNNDPATDIVFMYFVDPYKIEDYNQGKIPPIIRYHDLIANYYDIPALNLAKEVTDRINAGEFTWKDDFKNLHPSPFGQGVYARSMITFLENAWTGDVVNDEKILDYFLPQKLNQACYDNGILIPAKDVKAVKGWIYNENWIPEIKAGTRNNYTHVPMLVGDFPGKILKLSFEGNAVGIIPAAGPDAGIIEYRIDKGEWKKKDLFTKHSSHLYLPWPYMLADGLESGEHTLQLRISKDKNPKSVGNLCVLRYFFVNNLK
jgi:lysophospholipase L1-like esterase